MTEQGEQRPLTRRELRERQMRKQQLHVETADEAAAYTSEIPIVGQSRHGQDPGTPDPQLSPQELERRAAIYAELKNEVQISPEDEHGNPRSRREIRALFQEEMDRLFAEREAQRAEATETAETVDADSEDSEPQVQAEEPSSEVQEDTEDSSADQSAQSDADESAEEQPDSSAESQAGNVSEGAAQSDNFDEAEDVEPVIEAEKSEELREQHVPEESEVPKESDEAEKAEQPADGEEPPSEAEPEAESAPVATVAEPEAEPEAEPSDQAESDADSVSIDDLPPTEALSLDELFDESGEESASTDQDVEEPEQEASDSLDDETESDVAKGGWLSRLRRKKSVPVQDETAEEQFEAQEANTTEPAEPDDAQSEPANFSSGSEDTEASETEDATVENDVSEASEQASAVDDAEFTAEPETFTQLLKQSVKEEAQAETAEDIPEPVEAVEAEDAHVVVDGEPTQVEAEEVNPETEILDEIFTEKDSGDDSAEDSAEDSAGDETYAETDDDSHYGDAAVADVKEEGDESLTADDAETAPKSAASGGYSFPNIVPLEENQPVFDNNSNRDLEQSTAGFDNLISRAVEEESSANTSGTSALILPAMPNSDGISGPIGQTGELFVSGSIELPKSLGETGGHRLSAEELGLDDEHDSEQDQFGDERGSAPVSAVSAVSARNTNYSIVSPTKKDHSNKPMIFAISGGALVLIVGGVIYWGVTNGLFG